MTMQRAIFVSGAGGGIGSAGCARLAAAGFIVHAGVRDAAEADALTALHPDIRPVPLDVTSERSIQDAVAHVKAQLGEDKLFGYWNNAGIMRIAAFKNVSVNDIREIIDVNLLGCLLMLHAVMPLLAREQSRVVITGSATGMLAGPAVSVYSATKWGLEGFVDALRIELGCMGIRLSLVQPGLIRSPMSVAATPAVDALVQGMSEQDRRDYERLVRTIADTSAKASTPPDKVAGAVVAAFTHPKPKARYRVGADSVAVGVLRHLPDRMKDFIQRKVFGI